MNIDDAITAHSKWKMKLSGYLARPDKSLNAAVVGLDTECDLGKWVHGEGRRYSKLPEFSKLASAHARFHKAAAAVIVKAESGQKVAEEVVVGARSEFGIASSEVVKSLMAMKSKL